MVATMRYSNASNRFLTDLELTCGPDAAIKLTSRFRVRFNSGLGGDDAERYTGH